MRILKQRIAKELEKNGNSEISSLFTKEELDNAQIDFSKPEKTKIVCTITVDGAMKIKGVFVVKIEQVKGNSSYGYNSALYNAIRELESRIRTLATTNIKVEHLSSYK